MDLGGQRRAPAAFPRKITGTHCIGGCVGSGAGLDGCGKTFPQRDSNPGPSSPYRFDISTTLTQLLVIILKIHILSAAIKSSTFPFMVLTTTYGTLNFLTTFSLPL
jgi:hypothetical protein